MDREQMIINALRVAAAVYANDAAAIKEVGIAEVDAGMGRLRAGFNQQAKEALQLADFIENMGLNPLAAA